MVELIKKWWPFQTWRPLHQNEYERAMSGEISWSEALKHGPAENYRIPQIRERCKEALRKGQAKDDSLSSLEEERDMYEELLRDILDHT